MSLSPGARLGPYEILSQLGAGGMGEVYRAIDTRLDRTVALKVLPEEFLEGEERRARFAREAKTLASLNHPNIATLYSFEEIPGSPPSSPSRHVLTMELLEGESLREVLLRRTPTPRQVLSWMLQASQGLAAAHQKGIVHRDIKPENLFLTSDGRIKILDFGLAKLTALTPAETEVATASGASTPGIILGTIAYMSPEQIAAEGLDPRSDVFSLGVVLYELLAREHPFHRPAVPATLTAIINETPRDVSLRQPGIQPGIDRIVRRCLEKRREERYQSALELATALETILAGGSTAALGDVEEKSPYPGLSSFTEQDAGRFFGREEEIAALWRKLRDRKLLAVIGPSGAGKTSFVRAGMIPARPEGWAAIAATPGNAPLRSLGQALAPRLAHDPEALRKLLTFDDPDSAFELLSRWRRSNEEALVVLDQFEELFTLNPPETQARFVSLLGRLASEADVHVLISMRDDFLMRCHEHRALAAIFESLTPLGPMTRDGLRRALVEPAAKRGYRFEDDALVDEMIDAVEGARGALPLLAFAVSRLWERRKPEEKLLTRAAYAAIGGVAGALAQHAEETMDRIGMGLEPTVRDIFRNLTTAQGTRAVLDREELISALPDRAAAEAVLGKLIDARLLTTWETEEAEGQPARHRVEIVHESLLSAWPRLVRWQTQDADGAQLRDQLRQAAHLWEERGKADDLLWTGSTYLDYRVWRGRYPGKLSSLEEDFAGSMAALSERKTRRKRVVVGSVFVALALGLGIMAALWSQSLAARKRAEASKLLAIGQERLVSDPSEALAYTTASLELADSHEARVFALKTLWEAPPAMEWAPADGNVWMPRFSPDGRMLATGGYTSDARVFREDGSTPIVLSGHSGRPHWVGDRLVLLEDNRRLSVWSLPELRLERTLELGGSGGAAVFDSRLFVTTRLGGKDGSPAEISLRSWSPGERDPVELGRVPFTDVRGWGPGGASWLYAKGAQLLSRAVPIVPGGPETVLGEHAPAITEMVPWEHGVITLNAARQMKRWTFESGQARVEDFPTPPGADPPVGLNHGWIFELSPPAMRLWRHDAWPGARPLMLRRDASWYGVTASWYPTGDWLVATTATYTRLTFWPLRARMPLVVEGTPWRGERPMAFSPDGRWLATYRSGTAVRLWPLPPGSAEPRTLDVPALRNDVRAMAFDPGGRFLFCVGPSIWVVPLDGRTPMKLEGFTRIPYMFAAAVSPSGRYVATGYSNGEGDKTLRVWDLETRATRAFDLPQTAPPSGPTGNKSTSPAGGITSLSFAGESTLYSAGWGGVRRWDLASGRQEMVIGVAGEKWAVMAIRPDQAMAVTREVDDLSIDNCGPIAVHDLARHTSRELTPFGNCISEFDLDPTGRVLVTGSRDGIIRVGRVAGGEPHLLVGHKGGASAVVSPDLKWIASTGEDNTVRLWPMPDLDKPPLHTLPHAELVAKLKSITNLRAVRDAKASTGWKIEAGPFPGWKNVPQWQP